jgi:hypothetical protein
VGRGEKGTEWRRMIEVGRNGMGRQGMVWDMGERYGVQGNGLRCVGMG